jgi:hypothetical protein
MNNMKVTITINGSGTIDECVQSLQDHIGSLLSTDTGILEEQDLTYEDNILIMNVSENTIDP